MSPAWPLALLLIDAGPLVGPGLVMIRKPENAPAHDETRLCRDCGESKPLEQFNIAGRKRDGNLYYRPNCRACCSAATIKLRNERAAR